MLYAFGCVAGALLIANWTTEGKVPLINFTMWVFVVIIILIGVVLNYV